MSATNNDLIERGEALLVEMGLPNTDATWDWAMRHLMSHPSDPVVVSPAVPAAVAASRAARANALRVAAIIALLLAACAIPPQF